jgi:tetratricopeptide (TPR) repeat protein
MARKTLPLLLLFYLCCFFETKAQSETVRKARQEIYESYLNDDIARWERATILLETEYLKTKSKQCLREWTLGLYGLAGSYRLHQKDQKAEEALDAAEDNLDEMLDLDPKWPEANAMMGAVLALRLEMSPAKSIYLGPTSIGYIEDGVKFGARNPAAWVEMGNFRINAPSLFGGDVDEAAKSFQKAIELFDADPNRRQHSWLYLHAHVWLAKAYEQKGQLQKAKAQYEALQVYESRFKLLNEELLPQLSQKMSTR